MRKVIASLFITLDGVVEAPGADDNTLEGKRGWSMQFMNDEIGGVIFGQMQATDAYLLGRRTYQDFAAYWPNVPADDPFGQVMNGMRKYVVTTTLDTAEWNNSSVIKGNVVEEINKLKQMDGGSIAIVGSGTLVHSLLQHDVIDELQLMLAPVYLGVGKRLFTEGKLTQILSLKDAKFFSTGMVLLSYQPTGKA